MSSGLPAADVAPGAAVPLIDLQDGGIGDVVLACWIAHSAAAAGLSVRVNPRQRHAVARMLGIGRTLTDEEGLNWTRTEGIGLRYEYRQVRSGREPRFDLWCRSIGLPALTIRRPDYVEAPADAAWADAQWRDFGAEDGKPRILIFPEVAWLVRQWPLAYFIDLGTALQARGCLVALAAPGSDDVKAMGFRWLAGHSLTRIAALMHRATLVVANDSGPAHLAGAVGTPTLALCGPTDGAVVFAHDGNIRPLAIDRALLGCVGCHFDAARGYRFACKAGGCQALMKLDPPAALREAEALLRANGFARFTSCDGKNVGDPVSK